MIYKEGDMDLTRNRNLRKDSLFQAIKRRPTRGSNKFYLRAVYIKQNDQWRFLMGKCSVGDGSHCENEARYKEFYFLSKVFECSLTELIEKLYSGFSIAKNMPKFSLAENTSWEEELVPSHATKSGYPVRMLICNISNNSSFNDAKLVGYDVEFHSSAKEYIQEFFSLSGDLGSKEIREGTLMVELEDRKGAIKLDGSILSIEGKDDSLCIVGKIDDERAVCLKQGKTLEIEKKDIQKIELWLLNKDEEVLDYWSSSEWPYIYSQSKQVRDTIDYESIIAAGEGNICEFKPYISFKERQNSKIDQITKTVCALSNSNGGTLFIGINDNAEIEDITVPLRKDYRDELTQSLAGYISDLKTLLKDNLLSNHCFDVQAIKVFSKFLIVVNVSQAQEINCVKSERQAYIRKGASSMKMLPEEMQARKKNGLF